MIALIGVGAFFGVLFLGIVIGGFFVWIAAKIARVEKATFGRAIAASIAASVASGLVSWIFSFFGPGLMWSLLGALVGLLVILWVFKSMFDTSFGKAFLIWIFQLLAIALAVLIAGLTFATVLFI